MAINILPGGYTAPSPTESEAYRGDSKSAIARKRKIAESLMAQASEYQPSAHWATAIAKGLQGLAGGYLSRKADTAESDINRRLAEAIRGGNLDEVSRVGMETGTLEPSDVIQLKTAQEYRNADREMKQQLADQQLRMDRLGYNLKVRELNQPYERGGKLLQDEPVPYLDEPSAAPPPSRGASNLSPDIQGTGEAQPLQEHIPPGYPGAPPAAAPAPAPAVPTQSFGRTRVVGDVEKPLTPTDIAKKAEVKGQAVDLDSSISALNEAIKIAPQTYSGWGTNLRTNIGTNAPEGWVPQSEREKALASTRYQKLVAPEALTIMANQLKGSTAYQEVRTYLDMIADPSTPNNIKVEMIGRIRDRMVEHRAALDGTLSQMEGRASAPGEWIDRGNGARIRRVR